MNRNLTRLIAGFVCVLMVGGVFVTRAEAAAGVPRIMNYQGRLMTAAGVLLGGTGTDYCVKFSLYDDSVIGGGDNKLWPSGSPSTMTVVVRNGVFNAGIGDTNNGGDTLDFNFEDTDEAYLNVEVATKVGATCAPGDGAESFENLSPRQRVTASGYAINSATLGGQSGAYYLANAFSTSSAAAFAQASSSIPKTYANNSFIGINTFADITVTNATIASTTLTNATSTNLNVGATFSGAGLTSCSGSNDKLVWDAATRQFACSTDLSGSGGADGNWTFFNNTGIRPATTTNQVLVGGTATTSLAKFEAQGGAKFDNATSTTLNTTVFGLGGTEYFTSLLGSGLQNSGGILTLNAGGDWTGTFDGREGSYYLANSFSTSSAAHFAAVGLAFSTSSADYYASQNPAGFSTTSADYWKTQNNFYSTSSTAYDLSTYSKGYFFSTTSVAYWDTTQFRWATTSTDAWFATKSTDDLDEGISNFYYSSNRFAADLAGTTTDALDEGVINRYYSNSLVNLFIGASTTIPKTFTDNTFTGANTFGAVAATNATSTTLFSTFSSSTETRANTASFGAATVGSLTTSGTTTGANGVNITDGCFAVDGVCLTAGGSSASSTLLADSNSWTGINSFTGNTTFGNATSTTLRTSTLGVGLEYFTSLLGSGLQNTGGILTLNTGGDWTGTLDGQEGSYYLANSFSTTSASYFITQNQGASFSTTSAANFASVGLAHSTTSTAFQLAQSVTLGNTTAGTVSAGTTSITNLAVTNTSTSTFTGGVQTTALNVTGAGTSTAQNGFNIAAGCFAINGTCLTSGGSSASSTLLADSNTWSNLNIFANASTTLISGTTAWFTNFVGNLTGNVTGDVTGNASTATALQNARTINGTSFDGTQNITITAASSTLLTNTNTFTGTNAFQNITATGATTTALSTGIASTSLLVISNLNNTLVNTSANGTAQATTFSGPLSFTGGVLTLAQASGSQDGYLASSDWTTFNSRLSTTTLGLFDKGYFFSTTSASNFAAAGLAFSTSSADYYASQNPDSAFATSSASFFSSVGLAYSTTSTAYDLSTYSKGYFFSTTSASAFSAAGLSFSTTSTDFWRSVNNFFSTTSASHFSSLGLAFSTTSASYFLGQNLGNAFSTTSADYYTGASTTIPKTFSNNTFTGTNDFQSVTATGVTSTASFATTASSSNLFSGIANIGSLIATAITGNTITATNATTTTLFTNFSSSTETRANTASFGSLSAGSANVSATTTTTGLFATFSRLVSAVIDSLTASVLTAFDSSIGNLTATSSATLASTTAYGQFITGNIVATSTAATSTFAGSMVIGTSSGSYKVSVLGQTTGTSGATGTAIMAISNDNNTLSSGNNVLRLNIRTPYGTGCTSGTTCPRFIEYFAGVPSGRDFGGRGVGSLRLSTAGTGITQTSGAADFAEYMQLSEAADVGDLVSLNSSGEYRKATAGEALIGVISDNPAFVGNGNLEGEPNAYIVGFAGVIQTTVSDANGDINAGDLIAASDVPGVGIKLSESGYALGQALQSYSGPGEGTITVLVMPKFVDAAIVLESYGGGASGASGYWDFSTTTNTLSVASSTQVLTITGNTVLATTSIASLTTAGTTTGANGMNITDGCYAVDGVCITTGGSSASSTLFADSNSWTGINTFAGNTIFAGATSTTLNTGVLGLGGLNYFTSLTGSGLVNTTGVLTLDRTGDWTGTLDGQDGSYYLANSFSTSSASHFAAVGLAFSTSSADYYASQNPDSAFATTSADYWKSQNNFYSTSSTAFDLSTYSKGYFFSTTSVAYWDTTQFRWATTSTDAWFATKSTDDLDEGISNFYYSSNRFAADLAGTTTDALDEGVTNFYFTPNRVAGVIAGTTTDALAEGSTNLYFTNQNAQDYLDTVDKGYFFSTTSTSVFSAAGLSFSTTSTDYWKTVNNFFSTTSASHFSSLGLAFSTTSASTFLGLNQGAAFSTSSASAFLAQNQGNAFSTTSASNFAAAGLAFSTTSADYYASQNPAEFSTTSADYYVGSSTTIPKTFTTNTFVGSNSFQNITATGATTTSLSTGIASTSLLVISNLNNTLLNTSANGTVQATTFSGPLSFTAGQLTITQANGSTDGYLSSGDFSSFNSRLSTSSFGTIDKGFFFSTTSTDFWKTQTNFFSTSSTDYWKTVNNFFSTTSASHFTSLGLAFSTTSASAFLAQNQGAAFSTSSASNFAAVGLAFSTTSADYYASQNPDIEFSTTSADYWKTENNFFSTSSSAFFSASGLSFSTTSTDYWRSVNNFFSTTSASHFSSLGLAFSTTSASYFLGQNLGNAFSTTSATHFVHSSTTIPKTYTDNTFIGINTFANVSASNATTTNFFSTFSSSTQTRANTASFGSATIGSLTTTATSTGSNGFDITDGCYSIDGVCIASEQGGGGGSGELIAIQTFTAVGTTTYTPSAGATSAQVIVTAGGGGGGGVDSTDGTTTETPAGGAGAGATAIAHVDLTATTSVQVVVGAGGNGGPATGGTGVGGGNSSFGPTLAGAGGGNGGVGIVDSTAAPRTLGGGAGGSATAGDVQIIGGRGQDGNSQAGNTAFGGVGGASYWGGGGDGGSIAITASSTAGMNGAAYGSGGGGAALADTATGAAGGTGANGIVVVYEYGPFQGTMAVTNGGTGLSSAPTYGQLLMGDGAGGYVLVATSSIGLATTTDSLTEGVQNLYYTDERVSEYVGASTTIAKSFTANIFTALQTFADALFNNLTVSGTASSTNVVASTGLTFGTFTGILKSTAGVVAAALVDLTSDITGVLGIANGGTGTSTAPTQGQLLVGSALGGYELIATSTLGIYISDTTGTLDETRGGTGNSGYVAGDILYALNGSTLVPLPAGGNGTVLKMAGGLPAWGTDLQSGGGGGGGGGFFSTTTDSLAIFPSDPTYAVIVGNSATTTDDATLEVFGKSYFSNRMGIATSSAGSIFSIGNVANFSTLGSTMYTKLNLIDVEASGASNFANVVAATLAATNIGASSLSAGTNATTTIQGDATGTSTIQGVINVTGTNSTSTFSGNLQALSIRLTATSTGVGFDMTSGCYAINGVCTVNSLTATNTTLTVSPGNGAVGISLNLGNPNVWSGLQQFGRATTSLLEATQFYAREIQSTSTNALVLKSNVSSTAGLTFGSTSTPQVLGIDTVNNRVLVGTGLASTSLLVLDAKNTAGDPNGVTGASYYNSNTDEFRCYFGTAWVTCGGQAASSTGDVQFRNVDGSFTATSNFNWSQANNMLTIKGNPGQSAHLFTVASSTGTAMFGVSSAGVLEFATTTNPATSTGQLKIYAKDIAGRTMPKWTPPSGVDTPFQPAFFGTNIIIFAPQSATVGTGSLFGTTWQSNGTVSHPTPTAGIASQMHRTRYANVVTTQNQVLGPKVNTADGNQFWRGNATGQGGFFFFTRFIVELYPATTVRLFAGLSSSNTGVVASDTVAGDVVGLWHDTTDGADVLSLVMRNNVTTTKIPITGATLAAGQAFDFYMYAKPNDSTIYYRLDSVNTGNTIVDTSTSSSSLMPRNTIFMGPQVQMSNGTANTIVTTTAIGVNKIYVESDR